MRDEVFAQERVEIEEVLDEVCFHRGISLPKPTLQTATPQNNHVTHDLLE